ncbi:MAG: Hsp20/alpha crystallin family protein [Methylacidiphilales bacterium]|nr:Hsp20/alpha crystallin family protein [Candidatus Methylacidiphilales bacterium]
MSTLSTGNHKVSLWTVLAVILAIIVAFQGIVLYRVAKSAVSWPSAMSLTIPSWKPQIPKPNQVGGANVAVNALPGTGATVSSSDNDLWNQIEQFHNQMDRLFANSFAQPGFAVITGDNSGFTVPSMDLRDAKDHYIVQMDMPGADKSKIKVNIEGRLLSVSGQRETSNETKDSGNQMIRSERSTAEFERTITLPTPVNASTAKADYTNGVLTINLPKTDKTTDTAEVTVQ